MQVRVLREACCAQDDQMGPLEAVYALAPDATLGELVTAIVESKFLQFSSSHITLQGEIEGRPVVRIFSPYATGTGEPEFVADATRAAASVVGARPMRFRFVFQ